MGGGRRIVLAIAMVLSACGYADRRGSASSARPTLTGTRRDSADVVVLTLSHTPSEVADGQTPVDSIQPDLLVGDTKDQEVVWFGAVADVASLGHGRFAVLDHMERHVVLLDSLGVPYATLGRKGDGPGEFTQPWALAKVGTSIVVRQNTPTRTFTVFEADGSLRGTAPASPDGDWVTAVFRDPRNFMIGYKMGPEDLTRRLQPAGSASFIHLLEVNENPDFDVVNPPDFDAIPAFLIRYDLDGRVLDTVAELQGPPIHVEKIIQSRSVFYTQPLFSSGPVWATGSGWVAIGHGDSTEIVVRDTLGGVLLRVRMPHRRRAVSVHDREMAADWSETAWARRTPALLERLQDDPSRLKRAREKLVSDPNMRIRFADSIPMVTAAYGDGACLFLGGYRPEDWPDGTSLTWIAINVRTARVLGAFRLQPPTDGTLPDERGFRAYSRHGAAVRAIDGHDAFAYLELSDGAQAVERFPLSFECAG